MRDTRTTAVGLRSAIERSGYYPGLVADAVFSALGAEPVVSYVVQSDALFDPAMEVRRHMTVLVLTPSRLVYSHTDENPADDEPGARPQAETSTEAVRFSRISSVAVTRVVPEPASYVPGIPPTEVMVTIGWGVIAHVDLEPASCGDESCEADHGYTGTASADDIACTTTRSVSPAAAMLRWKLGSRSERSSAPTTYIDSLPGLPRKVSIACTTPLSESAQPCASAIVDRPCHEPISMTSPARLPAYDSQ